MIDTLTGLPGWAELVAELHGATPLALIVDLTGFVWLNDQFGFTEGDVALTRVARELEAMVERGVYRVGGDEFLVLAPVQTLPAAQKLGEAITQRVRALAIPYRRTDQPSRTVLEVKVVVLRLTTALMRGGRQSVVEAAAAGGNL